MLRSLFSAFLMYSRIPVPKVEWKEENRRYSLGFFPLVGAVSGGLLILWRIFCSFSGAGQIIFAAGAVLLPVAVTGGIHIDGFCDVTDARSSYADKKKRLEILSDPHIGSFAAINLSIYFLVQTALFTKIETISDAAFIACGYTLSRALSGLSAIMFRSARSGGSLQSFVRPAHRKITIIMELAFITVSAVIMTVLDIAGGLICLTAAVGVLIYCRISAYRNFGGYTGDICGWFLQLCEISVLASFVFYKLITEAVK